MLYCVAVLKRVALQLHCVTMTKYYQPRLNKSRMLGLHKLHVRTYPTGHVINVFVSAKI